jgi:chemotaxis protein methyltransferase CheR
MSLTQADYHYVRTLLRERSAIELKEDKAYLVEARLLPLARDEGMQTLGDLVRALERDTGPLRQKVVEAMTTNETSFFRDLHPFEELRKKVLPDLLHRRAAEKTLTVWSAACSSGQEPYSFAMMIREHFPLLANWKVTILATDLSKSMIDRASRGRYSQVEVNRGLPASLMLKYFQRQGLEWHLRDDIRGMVEYRVQNLVSGWPLLPPVDVVLLRNVLIYFDVTTKKTILKRMRRVLRSDGYLLLGGAETTLNLDDRYEQMAMEKVSFYRPILEEGAAA